MRCSGRDQVVAANTGGASHHSQRVPLDRLGMLVGSGGSEEPGNLSPDLHLLNIALHDGGPLAMYWDGRPRSGREVKAQPIR
jgi:hypothetical protein